MSYEPSIASSDVVHVWSNGRVITHRFGHAPVRAVWRARGADGKLQVSPVWVVVGDDTLGALEPALDHTDDVVQESGKLLVNVFTIPALVGPVHAIIGDSMRPTHVLGEDGYIAVSEASKKSKKVQCWQSFSLGLRAAVFLNDGPLLTAVASSEARASVHAEESASALLFISGDATGAVRTRLWRPERRAAAGALPYDPHNDCVACTLYQEVLSCIESTDQCMVVVLGALGGCAALWCDQEGKVRVTRFQIPVFGRTLRRGGVVYDRSEASEIRVICTGFGVAKVIRYNADARDGTPRVSVSTLQQAEPAGSWIRPSDNGEKNVPELLRGIDICAERKMETMKRSASLDRNLGSLNTAIMFAQLWSASKTGDTPRELVTARVTGAQTPVRDLCGDASLSAQVVVSVELSTDAEIVVGDGWYLRLRVKAVDRFSRSASTSTQGASSTVPMSSDGVDEGQQVPSGPSDESVTRVHTFWRAIPEMRRGRPYQAVVPVGLRSHAPIEICGYLVYRQSPVEQRRVPALDTSYAASSGMPDGDSMPDTPPVSEELLTLCLFDWRVMDVLDFSKRVNPGGLSAGRSPRPIPAVRLARYFDPKSGRSGEKSHQLSTRLELPIAHELARQLLCAVGELEDGEVQTVQYPCVIHAVTAFGLEYSVELTPTQTEPIGSRAVIRGPAHVISFARAGLLRRCIRVLSAGSGANGQQTPEEAAENGAPHRRAEVDERRILDAVDIGIQGCRRVEEPLQACERWRHELCDLGQLDACIGGRDEQSAATAVKAIQSVYRDWREALYGVQSML